jgi:hypothetical protein
VVVVVVVSDAIDVVVVIGGSALVAESEVAIGEAAVLVEVGTVTEALLREPDCVDVVFDAELTEAMTAGENGSR